MIFVLLVFFTSVRAVTSQLQLFIGTMNNFSALVHEANVANDVLMYDRDARYFQASFLDEYTYFYRMCVEKIMDQELRYTRG